MTDWYAGDADRRTNPGHDEEFQGYVRAKLEQYGQNQSSQWGAINDMKEEIAKLRVDVGSLKATARAWGIFAGALSGILAGVMSRIWRP